MAKDLHRHTIPVDRTLLEAMRKMDRYGSSTLFVVDGERMVGCLTDGDVRRLFMAQTLSPEALLTEVMTREPVTCTVQDDRMKMRDFMQERNIRHVPVLEDGRIVDILELGSFDEKVITGVRVEAAILCGGKGLRLGGLTKKTPKPLLSVGGIPLLISTIKMLVRAGIGRVNLLTHYLHEEFEERVGDGSDLGVEIRYWPEEEPLGTAGGLAMLRGQVEEQLLVLNGDVLTGLNFAALMESHLQQNSDITVCVHPYQVDIPYGVVNYDDAGNIVDIDEKPLLQKMVVAGVYAFGRDVLDLIPEGERFDIPQLLNLARSRGLAVKAFVHHEFWVDIGHPEDFQRANIEFFKNGL